MSQVKDYVKDIWERVTGISVDVNDDTLQDGADDFDEFEAYANRRQNNNFSYDDSEANRSFEQNRFYDLNEEDDDTYEDYEGGESFMNRISGRFSSFMSGNRNSERSRYDEDDFLEEENDGYKEPVYNRNRYGRYENRTSASNYAQSENRPSSGGVAHMQLIRAKRFSEAERIADHLRQYRSVIVNFEDMCASDQGKRDAQNLINYLCGATFAMHGKHEKISQTTFVFAVGGVDIIGSMDDSYYDSDNEEDPLFRYFK